MLYILIAFLSKAALDSSISLYICAEKQSLWITRCRKRCRDSSILKGYDVFFSSARSSLRTWARFSALIIANVSLRKVTSHPRRFTQTSENHLFHFPSLLAMRGWPSLGVLSLLCHFIGRVKACAEHEKNTSRPLLFLHVLAAKKKKWLESISTVKSSLKPCTGTPGAVCTFTWPACKYNIKINIKKDQYLPIMCNNFTLLLHVFCKQLRYWAQQQKVENYLCGRKHTQFILLNLCLEF